MTVTLLFDNTLRSAERSVGLPNAEGESHAWLS